jgi:hypothetical protein
MSALTSKSARHPGRAQAMLVEGAADGIGQLRRVGMARPLGNWPLRQLQLR